MPDASRQFAALSESIPFAVLRDHLAAMPGATATEMLTDRITEAWIDFTYCGHQFTVNNQFGEYWFFVRDASCPEDILREVVRYCAKN